MLCSLFCEEEKKVLASLFCEEEKKVLASWSGGIRASGGGEPGCSGDVMHAWCESRGGRRGGGGRGGPGLMNSAAFDLIQRNSNW
jgi:hypothetical protein